MCDQKKSQGIVDGMWKSGFCFECYFFYIALVPPVLPK